MKPAVTAGFLALTCAISVATACGGRAAPPSGPSTSAPQIGGSYSGPTADTSTTPSQQVSTWTIKFTRAGDTSARFRSCTGTFTIQQTGSSFTGSFTQGGSCAAVSGEVAAGTVRSDGAVTFSLMGPASDALSWTGFSQCAVAVSGTMDFTGTINGALLDASFAHDALIQCPNEGAVSLNVRIRGNR